MDTIYYIFCFLASLVVIFVFAAAAHEMIRDTICKHAARALELRHGWTRD